MARKAVKPPSELQSDHPANCSSLAIFFSNFLVELNQSKKNGLQGPPLNYNHTLPTAPAGQKIVLSIFLPNQPISIKIK